MYFICVVVLVFVLWGRGPELRQQIVARGRAGPEPGAILGPGSRFAIHGAVDSAS